MPVYAEDSLQEERCLAIEMLATIIMGNRQAGISMADQYKVVIVNGGTDKLTKNMIKMAYAEPLYGTEKYKKEAEVEFGNKMFQMCLAHVPSK